LEDYRRIAHVLVNHNGMLYQPNGPNLERMLRSIAGPGPELAICNSADGWRLVRALREVGLPHLISLVHERVIHYPPDVWRSIHQNSNRVIFPAHAVKTATTAVFPDFEDAYVVPQGLLKPEFGRGDRNAARIEVRKKLGLSPDTTVILGCGTQDLRKGIDLFVQLAARVRAQAKRDVHFVWLGAEQRGSYFSLMDLDISLLNLSSTVSLLGEVTDPEPYFLAADAFALTSRDDPFPCVIHEAMACALPIVAFDGSGGAKEAISGGCGIVVPYLDIEAMVRSLISVVEDPLRHAAVGESAQLRVRSVYRFSDYAERIRDICEVAMGKRAPTEAQDTGGSIAQHSQDHFGEDARFQSGER
jgi:glycosyltransferase involved in cell wall biosynthesis